MIDFQDFLIWLAPEHNFRSRHFMVIFTRGARVTTKWHFTSFAKTYKNESPGMFYLASTRTSLLKSSFIAIFKGGALVPTEQHYDDITLSQW